MPPVINLLVQSLTPALQKRMPRLDRERMVAGMVERVNRLIEDAEYATSEKRHEDAAHCYEKAAELTPHKSQAAKLMQKASQSYLACWMREDSKRCARYALELMEGSQKIDYLFERWQEIIDTIAHFEYDCSYEWRGETDGSHDSYLEDLDRLVEEARAILQQAFDVEGVDEAGLIEKAGEECRKWESTGGWGSARCWKSISGIKKRLYPK